MLTVILLLIGGCLYFACPLPIQLVLLLINMLTPDSLIFLDEAIMVGGVISKIELLQRIGWWIRGVVYRAKKHPVWAFLCIVGVAAVIHRLVLWLA